VLDILGRPDPLEKVAGKSGTAGHKGIRRKKAVLADHQAEERWNGEQERKNEQELTGVFTDNRRPNPEMQCGDLLHCDSFVRKIKGQIMQ